MNPQPLLWLKDLIVPSTAPAGPEGGGGRGSDGGSGGGDGVVMVVIDCGGGDSWSYKFCGL